MSEDKNKNEAVEFSFVLFLSMVSYSSEWPQTCSIANGNRSLLIPGALAPMCLDYRCQAWFSCGSSDSIKGFVHPKQVL